MGETSGLSEDLLTDKAVFVLPAQFLLAPYLSHQRMVTLRLALTVALVACVSYKEYLSASSV